MLRALGLGDLLTAVPALRALRRQRRHDRIVVYTPTALWPLVELLGVADELVDSDFRRAPPAALRALDVRPVVAVNLHGSGPGSHLALRGLQPERLVAFAHPGVHRGAASWDPDEHEVARWCRLLECDGIPTDPTDLHVDAPDPPAWAAGATILHVGASAPARCWPSDRWAALARRLVADGHHLVLTGTRTERSRAEAVAAATGGAARVVAGATSVLELLAVVGAANLLVAGDTGVAHVATAVGTPSVLLFGPTSPALWGPPAHLAERHVVLWAGHRGDPHADAPDSGMLALDVDTVATALAQAGRRRADLRGEV